MSAGTKISDQVHEAGKELCAATQETIAGILNAAINRFMGSFFAATPGGIVDEGGATTESFAAVVHLPDAAPDHAGNFPADKVAAVIDTCEELTIESLRAAYARIAHAKTLKKAAPAYDSQRRSTLGILLAIRSALPLEAIAEELDRLNATVPEHRWLDMVAVAATGTISYAVQFPGQSELNDFMLPDEHAKSELSPPIYVVSVMRPTGAHTFNKMLAYLAGHLITSAPDVRPPLPNTIMEGVVPSAMTFTGYQFNLNGSLVPVPRQFYNDRYIPPRPFLIEDPKGHPLAAVQFLPWQEGAVILLRGKLPLDGLLVFLGKKGMQRIIRLPDVQLSYVLPISHADFIAFLKAFVQRSNMKVRADPGRVVVQKIADEGTQTPFMARIMLGIMRLRDGAYPETAAREEFDRLFDFLVSSLLSARTSALKIVQIWEDHARKIASGEIVQRQGHQVRIEEYIDRELRTEIETFLNATVRAMKTGMQHLGSHLKVEIGFLFQKQAAFEKGIAALQATDPDLAGYLRQVRIWSEPVLKSRIDLEHSIWTLPRVAYTPTDNEVRIGEPQVAGVPISEFAKTSLDRLICFAEEFIAHCLQRRMPAGISIAEVPLADRPAEAPERFRLTLVFGGLPPWRIAYHASKFDET